MGNTLRGRLTERCRHTAIAAGIALFAAVPAHAVELFGSSDWQVRLDNTLSYNLGIRAQDIDDNIGNNPLFHQSDYKFDSAGDLVTNRIADLMEFDAVYQDRYGLRLSASAWKDFAYDDKVKSNPGEAAPGVPYAALTAYRNNRYSGYTKKYFIEGAQLLDAFVFANFSLAGREASLKLGRLTQYWGNALIFGSEGINYGQNASDFIKAFTSPGTQAKELAIPRAQAYFQIQLNDESSFAAQYFGEFAHSRLPEGGTYLGTFGFAFDGPNQIPGAGVPHGDNVEPDHFNDNFGLKYAWSPAALRGTLGIYYRRLDETIPWLLIGVTPAPNYHLSYADGVDLYGLSLDKQIGPFSTGFEVSYRQNTAFSSGTGPLPSDLAGKEGARGDSLNFIANLLAGLTPTALYDTGTFLVEATYTREMKVRSNADLYNSKDNPAACPTGDVDDGCSTKGAAGIAAQFAPQWLQVLPGVDIDTPLFVQYGAYGNAANNFAFLNEGLVIYTAGVHALIRQRYNVTLQYNGYHARTNGKTNSAIDGGADPAMVPVGTPGFPSYYRTTSMPFFWNDKGWVSLNLSYTF